jgi:hypothetical protein
VKKLRRWLLNSTNAYSLPLGADSRLCATDYQNDQVWHLPLATGEAPALALQTRYNGRVGLASIVPMWFHEGQMIYEAGAYHQAPVIRYFAPGYLGLEAQITADILLHAEYWAVSSSTIGALFTLKNISAEPVDLSLHLIAHIVREGKENRLRLMPTPALNALHLGPLGDLNPLLFLENGVGKSDSPATNPKLVQELHIPAGKTISTRWVHAAKHTSRASLNKINKVLTRDWAKAIQTIATAAQAIPTIETGDTDTDAVIASAYHHLVLGYIESDSRLPYQGVAPTRSNSIGIGPTHQWWGQSPSLSYLTALGMAPISAEHAQGLIYNYLSIQHKDGWIDWQADPQAPEKRSLLCMPILARLAWGIFQYTEDTPFLREVFPGLLKFFQRWLQESPDQSGFPGWQHENQTGYPYFPAFARSQSWSQGLDIRTVKTPDLLAYLLSEAVSLRAIAYYLHDAETESALSENITQLKQQLATLWDENTRRYIYRDRATGYSGPAQSLLTDAQGDLEHFVNAPIEPPNRVIVRVEGGTRNTPNITLTLDGVDANGKAITEEVPAQEFVWSHGRGVYTSQKVFAQLNRVQCSGLSRVYQVSVTTPDTQYLDINALLPLWSVALDADEITALSDLLTDEKHFWRASGVSMTAADSPLFDPTNANGSGGVWPFWLTLMGEALIETGQHATASELMHRLLKTQVAVLQQNGEFSQFYHSEKAKGLGVESHLSGIVPVHLLLRVLGVRVISSGKVWAGGPYHWPTPVQLTHHGVKVQRDADGTRIQFPSGHQVSLPPEAEWQEVIDPNPKPIKKPLQMLPAKKPAL